MRYELDPVVGGNSPRVPLVSTIAFIIDAEDCWHFEMPRGARQVGGHGLAHDSLCFSQRQYQAAILGMILLHRLVQLQIMLHIDLH